MTTTPHLTGVSDADVTRITAPPSPPSVIQSEFFGELSDNVTRTIRNKNGFERHGILQHAIRLAHARRGADVHAQPRARFTLQPFEKSIRRRARDHRHNVMLSASAAALYRLYALFIAF